MAEDGKSSKELAETKRGPHRFTKGYKKPPKSGRVRGVPNKLTMAMKDAIIAAAETLGEKKWSVKDKAYTRNGKGGLYGYMLHLGRHHENLFAPFLLKVLPMHVTSAVVNRNYRTEEEVRALCAERGIDFDSIMDIGEPMPPDMIDVTPETPPDEK